MSKTFRHTGNTKKQGESRVHSQHHRFDGHKLAAMVNHQYDIRHVNPATITRTGQRHK